MATGRGGSKKKQGNAQERKWYKAEDRKRALMDSAQAGQSRKEAPKNDNGTTGHKAPAATPEQREAVPMAIQAKKKRSGGNHSNSINVTARAGGVFSAAIMDAVMDMLPTDVPFPPESRCDKAKKSRGAAVPYIPAPAMPLIPLAATTAATPSEPTIPFKTPTTEDLPNSAVTGAQSITKSPGPDLRREEADKDVPFNLDFTECAVLGAVNILLDIAGPPIVAAATIVGMVRRPSTNTSFFGKVCEKILEIPLLPVTLPLAVCSAAA